FDQCEPRWIGLDCDEDGMRPDAVRAALAERPAFVYVIPDFDNPAGRRMSLERREALLDEAARNDVLVIEDAPYRELRFEGDPLPTLHELAPERVVHVGTLSKTLAPGLRLAWLAGPRPVLELVERAKQASDLHTSTFVQAVALEAVADGALERRLPALRTHYRSQRDALTGALRDELGDRFSFQPAPGGMFLWGRLANDVDASDLLRVAVGEGVTFVPGAAFYPADGPVNRMRLSYSLPTPERLRTAARRLRVAQARVDAAAGRDGAAAGAAG
ncbi:MAG: PLP-dependent aminotransferase family protein, partial [Trueperaceae bacterium]